jgi:hypothetical protein
LTAQAAWVYALNVALLLLLALLALLAAPASVRAQDQEQDSPGLPAMLAQNRIDGLPASARYELRRMFLRYRDEVSTRLDEGWSADLLSDATLDDPDAPFQPARLLESAVRDRRAEIAALEKKMAETNQNTQAYSRLLDRADDLKDGLWSLEHKAARQAGNCRDWSDDIWAALTALHPTGWSISDLQRTAMPYLTSAVACWGGDPGDADAVCLAFDPWGNGKTNVYAFDAWDQKAPGGRIPPNFFLNDLPKKAPKP